jgi:DNA-binding transcriptional MerR regulator
MEKSSEAFLTIGEMSKRLSVKPHILRYWEEQFPMLKPLKRAGGRRHYRSDDAVMLTTIHRLLNTEGYTIKGACKYLNDAKRVSSGSLESDALVPDTPVSVLHDIPDAGNNAISVSALQAIRTRLASALAAA